MYQKRQADLQFLIDSLLYHNSTLRKEKEWSSDQIHFIDQLLLKEKEVLTDWNMEFLQCTKLQFKNIIQIRIIGLSKRSFTPEEDIFIIQHISDKILQTASYAEQLMRWKREAKLVVTKTIRILITYSNSILFKKWIKMTNLCELNPKTENHYYL